MDVTVAVTGIRDEEAPLISTPRSLPPIPPLLSHSHHISCKNANMLACKDCRLHPCIQAAHDVSMSRLLTFWPPRHRMRCFSLSIKLNLANDAALRCLYDLPNDSAAQFNRTLLAIIGQFIAKKGVKGLPASQPYFSRRWPSSSAPPQAALPLYPLCHNPLKCGFSRSLSHARTRRKQVKKPPLPREALTHT